MPGCCTEIRTGWHHKQSLTAVSKNKQKIFVFGQNNVIFCIMRFKTQQVVEGIKFIYLKGKPFFGMILLGT